MTYDELLFKIYEIHNDNSNPGQEATKQYKGMIQFMQALRAVVELHSPFDGYCQRCTVNNWGETRQEYPCDEIQIIEKELR